MNKHLFQNGRLLLTCIVLLTPTTGNPDVEKSRSHAPRYDTYVPIVNKHFKTVLVFFVPVVVCVPVSCHLCCCRVSLQPQFFAISPRIRSSFSYFSAKIRQVLTSYRSSFALFSACCVVVEFHSSHSFAIFQ